MANRLFWKTVSPPLEELLRLLMEEQLFAPFRLVGGTNLSLQIGHRESVDIDLFTDAEYGSIKFELLDDFLRQSYAYVNTPTSDKDARADFTQLEQVHAMQ